MSDPVLVVGGGLAGVACAKHLGDEGIPVTLVAETLGLLWAVGLAARGPRLAMPTGSRDGALPGREAPAEGDHAAEAAS